MSNGSGFDPLFSPLRIGSVELKNRIVFPPLTTRTEVDGRTSELSLAFYRRIASGGAALVYLGDVSATRTHSPNPLLCDDSYIPDLLKLTKTIHAEGSLAAAQVYHPEYEYEELEYLKRRKGLEAFRQQFLNDMENYVNRIDAGQIKIIQQRIVETAARCRKAGFDIIQLHGDRLVGLFCSPLLNMRTDTYGGSMEGRFTFVLELVEKLRNVLPEVALDYKMAIIRSDPPMGKAGPPLEEAVVLARQLESLGVNSFHVSIADHTGVHVTIPPQGSQPPGCFVDLAEGIKKNVEVPVAAVGRIFEPALARSILSEGRADMVALGRQLICDPRWPEKVRESREDEIRLCIMCNRGCTDNVIRRVPIQCAINPVMGDLPNLSGLTKADSSRRIVVVGAGPGGLEYARTAALRGHSVRVYEKEERIGGQLLLAAVPPGKDEILRLLEFYRHDLHRLGVPVITGVVVTPEILREEAPDLAVLALGSQPLIPPIPGVDGEGVVSAWDILSGRVNPRGRVVIIGGGAVGVETAEFLAPRVSSVVIIEMLDTVAADESPTVKPYLFDALRRHDVHIHTNARVLEIGRDSVLVRTGDGDVEMPVDTVVLAAGAATRRKEAEELAKAGGAAVMVGDCAFEKPGLIRDAVYHAYAAAKELN